MSRAMHHPRPSLSPSRQALVTRQRFAFAGALVVAALLPFLLRLLVIPDPAYFNTSQVSLVANIGAIVIATWIRLSVGTFPGTRSGTLIAPSVAVAHGVVLAMLLMTRLPYDRLGILTGFIAHMVWAIGLHVAVHRRVRRRFAVVPCGTVDHLELIDGVDWKRLRRPQLAETIDCHGSWPIFPPTFPPPGKLFWPTQRSPEGWSIRSSNCPNRSPGGSRSRICRRIVSAI